MRRDCHAHIRTEKAGSVFEQPIAFQDTEPVKIVTGIRRCGKSSLLKLMMAHLRENGIPVDQIVEINFESHDFLKMTSDALYQHVKERILPGKRLYLFLDESQRIGKHDVVRGVVPALDRDLLAGARARQHKVRTALCLLLPDWVFVVIEHLR